MRQRRLWRTTGVVWVVLLRALLLSRINRRTGCLCGRSRLGSAGVAIHDRAQIHRDSRGVTTTTSASRCLSRGTRDWRSRHPDRVIAVEGGGLRGGTKRKGEVLAAARANQGAWEDHRRFGEKRGKATISMDWIGYQSIVGVYQIVLRGILMLFLCLHVKLLR